MRQLQPEDNSKKIQESILNDNQCKFLLTQKEKVYQEMGLQGVIVGGRFDFALKLDAHRMIKEIDKRIDFRIGQIISHYSN